MVVPHWNNTEGGAHHDTSRCYSGRPRMEYLRSLLPDGVGVVGIDEHTALVMDPATESCSVMGERVVTVIRGGEECVRPAGRTFALRELGFAKWPAPSEGIPAQVWREAVSARDEEAAEERLPEKIAQMIESREQARLQKDWEAADALREGLAALGYRVQDTLEGPRWQRMKP